ncbi:MAG: signal peptidase I [Clostridiales bacterium]|nr:signal peptidase I [Clostridia bacterium]MCR4564320.1 signal peptidase I [Clostridiales bacterium]
MSDFKKSVVDKAYYIVSILALAFVIIFVIFTFVFRTSVVRGESMLPNLVDGERVIVRVFAYEPKQGDVIIISQPNAMELNLVKRVIATEGQTVDIDTVQGKVYVDGEELVEPYVKEPTFVSGDWDYPITVPENCVFAMGDNRNNSTDSRFSMVGFIQTDYIVGQAVIKLDGFKFSKVAGSEL